jgi:hypothetical protein
VLSGAICHGHNESRPNLLPEPRTGASLRRHNAVDRAGVEPSKVPWQPVYRFFEDLRPVVSDAPLTFVPLIAFAGLALAVLDVTLVPAIFLVACATNLPVATLRVADPRIR